MVMEIAASLRKSEDRIRVGSKYDGGYVISKTDLQDSDCLLSFGVSDDWSFEKEFSELNPKVHIHAYDYSVSIFVFIRMSLGAIPRILLRKIDMYEFVRRVSLPFRYFWFFKGDIVHFREKVTSPAYQKLDVSIDAIFSRIESNLIFLKMDIEGSEYRVLEEIVSYSERVIGMVIEFHDIDFLEDKFLECLTNLSTRYDIIHVHGNNYGPFSTIKKFPNVVEITFSRRGSHENETDVLFSPTSGLDAPNNPKAEDYIFEIYSSFLK